MFDNPTDAYVGDFSAFDFDVTDNLAPNSVVIVGQLVGVTREPFAANSQGVAFMAGPRRCFSLPKATGAATRGSIAYYDATAKKVAMTSGTGDVNKAIGVFWNDAESADAFVQVLLS